MGGVTNDLGVSALETEIIGHRIFQAGAKKRRRTSFEFERDNEFCFKAQLTCLWDIIGELLSGKLDRKVRSSRENKGLRHRFGCLLQKR